jgi:hypothetical protein
MSRRSEWRWEIGDRSAYSIASAVAGWLIAKHSYDRGGASRGTIVSKGEGELRRLDGQLVLLGWGLEDAVS